MPNVFVDTNVFLYRVDDRDLKKRDRAISLLSEIGENITTSTQVLQEFYFNATIKLRVTPAYSLQIVEQLCRQRVVQITPTLILSSIDTSERYRISLWDSLIVEAAAAGGCLTLYTEDLNHGQKIRGVLVQNPFL